MIYRGLGLSAGTCRGVKKNKKQDALINRTCARPRKRYRPDTAAIFLSASCLPQQKVFGPQFKLGPMYFIFHRLAHIIAPDAFLA